MFEDVNGVGLDAEGLGNVFHRLTFQRHGEDVDGVTGEDEAGAIHCEVDDVLLPLFFDPLVDSGVIGQKIGLAGLFVIEAGAGGLAFAGADDVEGGVADEAGEPGAEKGARGIALVGVKPAPEFEKDLLFGVFQVRAAEAHGEKNFGDEGLVIAEELLPGRIIFLLAGTLEEADPREQAIGGRLLGGLGHEVGGGSRDLGATRL